MKQAALIYRILLLSSIQFLSLTITAQTSLDEYIRQGLSSNESIQQQYFLLGKSMYALQEAKTLFLPSITFSASYTRAHGGRTIDVPTGQLLNKAYATLNTLTSTSNFPQLQDQHIQLNPDNFYDAKFRTSMPLLNAELTLNKKIKNQQVDLQQTEIQLYKRELIKEIKKAYYQYAKAENAVKIYQTSMTLVRESNRINTALFNNQKVNRTSVIRSENEISKLNSQFIIAEQNRKSAQAYFNFLLNRPLSDSVRINKSFEVPVILPADSSVVQREELTKLKLAGAINTNLEGLAKSYIIPKINVFVDLGSQAFDFKYNGSSRYYLMGLMLEWNLFSSGRNFSKQKQAAYAGRSILAENNYVEAQLTMQLAIAKNDFQAALAQYDAAQQQAKAADLYYRDELKLYKEGKAIFIELLDAQNELINALLETNIALFDTCIRHADIERASASLHID